MPYVLGTDGYYHGTGAYHHSLLGSDFSDGVFGVTTGAPANGTSCLKTGKCCAEYVSPFTPTNSTKGTQIGTVLCHRGVG